MNPLMDVLYSYDLLDELQGEYVNVGNNRGIE